MSESHQSRIKYDRAALTHIDFKNAVLGGMCAPFLRCVIASLHISAMYEWMF
jgi:hypothetical protein